jgi:hypothetical protein
MSKEHLSISEAAKKLNISIDTLRRWDKTGKIRSIRKSKSSHRYYKKTEIFKHSSPEFKQAYVWAKSSEQKEPDKLYYCQNSAIFQAKLSKLAVLLNANSGFRAIAPLLLAVAGEIGNNSFDHNLGSWPDVPGIFFGYDLKDKKLSLADRGQGIYQTLKRVRTEIKDDHSALKIAFTEIVTGRAPEKRGNGLKFVRQAITMSDIELFFQSGQASLFLDKETENINIENEDENIQGCIALISF